MFHGFGPLPAAVATREQTGDWDHVGATRVVELADGSEARERLTAYEAPEHFAYRVGPFTGPLRRVVEHADGAWWFTPAGGGATGVRWTYACAHRGTTNGSDDMPGIKKRMLGSVTVMAVTAASLASLAGPAQAYDRGTCDQKFGVGNWADEDTFKVDTGEVGQVGFGDNLHLFGQPQGTAVVCFATDGGVSLTGRLFADSGLTVINVEAKVAYFRGTVAASTSSHELITSMAGSKVVNQTRAGGNFTKVRVRLFSLLELRHTVNIVKGH